MKKMVLLLAVLLAASSCSFLEKFDGQPELTSPCVGLDDSPCGPKRPVNLWLQGKDSGLPA